MIYDLNRIATEGSAQDLVVYIARRLSLLLPLLSLLLLLPQRPRLRYGYG
jgi:hypothetical protein